MLEGSFGGIPFKVFAVGAPGARASRPALFALAAVPIRLVRFAATVIVIDGIGRLAARRIGLRARMLLLAAFWVLFYAEFWFRWSGRIIGWARRGASVRGQARAW